MSPSAVVVGGGYAGVAAAIALSDRGVRVTLLESRRQWGGRATSWPDPRLGEQVDNGQHVLLGCYGATRALLARLGTAARVPFPDGLDLSYVEWGGRRSRLYAPGPFGRFGMALGLLFWTRVPIAERFQLARAIREARRPAPGMSVEGWLESERQGAQARRFFWHPLCESALNETADRADASLLFPVIEEAFRGSASGAAIGIPRAGLAELVKPIERLVPEAGGEARLGATVRGLRALHPVAGANFEVALEGGGTIATDAVVLAVPAPDAMEIAAPLFEGRPSGFPQGLARAAAVPTSPIITVTLWFERRVLPAPLIGLVPLPQGGGPGFGWAFDRALLLGVREGLRAVVLVASAARALAGLRSDQIVERARAALDGYALTRLEPRATRVIKEPRATPAFTADLDPLARPPVATGIPGLALAGDWTDTGLPATIEGAVRSGTEAARVVARHLTETRAQPSA